MNVRTDEQGRIGTLDILRGLALLGCWSSDAHVVSAPETKGRREAKS